MTYIVITARSHHEFASADAINDMGGFAVVPRRVEIIKDKAGNPQYEYRPFLPKLIFASLTEEQWHMIRTKRLFHQGAILPPIRREIDLLPQHWNSADGVTAFLARAEVACNIRIEQFETGRRVARYRKGDILRIMGDDILNGHLRDALAKFIRLDKQGRIIAEVEGVTLMGKPVLATLGPGDVRMAAE